MSNPLQSAESALLTAPLNLWLKGSVESDVQIGGVTYNSMSRNMFFRTLVGDVYVNGGVMSRAAAVIEALSPRGVRQMMDYQVVTEEVDPLRPLFRTVSIASRFGVNEAEAQGHQLSNVSNPARNLIRQYIPNAHTTLQPQVGVSGQLQGNPDNNYLYCLLGVPEDYVEMLPNQTFFNTAVTVYYNTDMASANYNNWIITDGNLSTSSPTSIASAADTANGVKSVVNGAFVRMPYMYEALVFERWIDQDATDIAARRRIGIFRRFVNYITAAVGAQITVAKNAGLLPLGEIINAGWGTDASTPSTTVRTTRVTGEVLLPFIPVGTKIIRGQANDGEASEPKVSFARSPIPQDHYCMITRYGLTQTTDVAAIVGEHQRKASLRAAEALVDANENTPYRSLAKNAVLSLQSKRAFSETMFNFKSSADGLGTINPDTLTDSQRADLLADYLLFRELQSVKLAVHEKNLQMLFGAGKLQNPVSTLLSSASNNFAGLVYNPNRVARGRNGIGVNGQPIEGGSFNDYKFGSYSQGLLRSVPIENTFDMAVGNFDFHRFAEIVGHWIDTSGATEGYMFTDSLGEIQLVNYFMTNGNIYRINLTPRIETFTGITIRDIDYAGMKIMMVVLPELTWATSRFERGSYTFINFGTEINPTVIPFYVGSPMTILRNEQQNGKLINSVGLRVETGLICRGFKQNAFKIRRTL